jgi:hypothetical protein
LRGVVAGRAYTRTERRVDPRKERRVSGVSIKYTGSDGRSYPDAGSMIRAGVDRILENKFAAVERAARQPTCAVHRRKASVRRTRSGDKVNFHIEACCDQLKDQAKAAADRAFKA